MVLKYKNFRDIIPHLKKRPGMFLGNNSIFAFRNYLDGYSLALQIHGIQEEGLFDEQVSFHDWIALKTEYYESTSGWANMLTEFYGKEKALDKFWSHYEEYQNRKHIVIKQATVKKKNGWKYNIDSKSKQTSCYILPHKIEILKYDNNKGSFIRFLNLNKEEINQQEYCLNETTIQSRISGLEIPEEDWVYLK